MISTETVRRATGRDLDEWYAVLDAWGAADRAHGDIAAWIADEHGIDNWWTQTITVEYERARGLRAVGSGRDGTYAVTASRTVEVPVDRLFEAVTDAGLRERWLPGADLRERTSQPGRSARFDVGGDGTRVNLGFTARGEKRSQVALQHERLPDAASADKAKAYWRDRLAALKTLLEG